MPQSMAVCPSCGRPVYGNSVTYTDYTIEIDCPRCGIQERDAPWAPDEKSDVPGEWKERGRCR
uniref:Uncharacterized protein n=1 Tax=viral metagenome TaxID=1070528 RepID=A0A6M3J615_9ZZZZ